MVVQDKSSRKLDQFSHYFFSEEQSAAVPPLPRVEPFSPILLLHTALADTKEQAVIARLLRACAHTYGPVTLISSRLQKETWKRMLSLKEPVAAGQPLMLDEKVQLYFVAETDLWQAITQKTNTQNCPVHATREPGCLVFDTAGFGNDFIDMVCAFADSMVSVVTLDTAQLVESYQHMKAYGSVNRLLHCYVVINSDRNDPRFPIVTTYFHRMAKKYLAIPLVCNYAEYDAAVPLAVPRIPVTHMQQTRNRFFAHEIRAYLSGKGQKT